jgi:hypothetical protein
VFRETVAVQRLRAEGILATRKCHCLVHRIAVEPLVVHLHAEGASVLAAVPAARNRDLAHTRAAHSSRPRRGITECGLRVIVFVHAHRAPHARELERLLQQLGLHSVPGASAHTKRHSNRGNKRWAVWAASARKTVVSRVSHQHAASSARPLKLPGLERLFEFHWYSGTGEVVCGSFTGTGEVVSRGSYADFWWFLTLKSVSDPVKNQSSVSSVAQNY